MTMQTRKTRVWGSLTWMRRHYRSTEETSATLYVRNARPGQGNEDLRKPAPSSSCRNSRTRMRVQGPDDASSGAIDIAAPAWTPVTSSRLRYDADCVLRVDFQWRCRGQEGCYQPRCVGPWLACKVHL